MKAGIIMAIVILILGAGVYFGYTFLGHTVSPTMGQVNIPEESTSKITTVQGLLMKVTNPKDDYTHTIKTETTLVRAASYTVTLDEYVGKNVEVTGQNSGNTLFVDTITELK